MIIKVLIVALVAAFSTSLALAADFAPRATADVDTVRFAEYDSIFAVAVMGYTASDRQVRMCGHDHGMAKGDMAMAKDHHMAEGARCGMAGHHSGCGCQKACCWERQGCYDCWGVWQTDDMYDFAAIRESDYDPVMGRGDTGRGWFW